MVAVGGCAGRVRRAVVVRLRRVDTSVSASTPSGRAGPGVLAGRGGGRSGVLRSAEWPIRATGQYRANGAPHDDACPFDGTHDNRADDVSDRLSVALTYGVAFCFAVSFALTGSISGRCRMLLDEGRQEPV